MTPEKLVNQFEHLVRRHQALSRGSIEASMLCENELKKVEADLLRALEQPTWLDQCAWAVLQGLLSRSGEDGFGSWFNGSDNYKEDATTCYAFADAMLAEKVRREGGAQ